MKHALVGGVAVRAGPEALLPGRGQPQPTPLCPSCGEPVELRHRRGTWHYRHVRGAGARCPLRAKPVSDGRPGPGLPNGDPDIVLAMAVVERAVRSAREGDLSAILMLAFGPLAHLVLDAAGLTPEEILDRIVPQRGEPSSVALVTEDEAAVLEAVRKAPGPVFDLRRRHRDGARALERLDWYVPLWPAGPARRRMVRRVLGMVERAYVLGTWKEWAEIWAQDGRRSPWRQTSARWLSPRVMHANATGRWSTTTS